MSDLKQCPFCGSAAIYDTDGGFMACDDCGCGAEAWNKRADDSPFKVGDRVRNIHTERTGTLTKGVWHFVVSWDSGCTYSCMASELELVPDLPDDHIDRFWVPGALIQHSANPYPVAVVMETWGVKIFGKVLQPSVTAKVNHCLTGWSFHPDSPIKEKREP